MFGDGLVEEVLFCCGDSFEEDLRWEPRLRIFVDLVEFDDDMANDGAAWFKTVKAFGTFFFSATVELKTKGPGGGRSGHEMIDSNTSLPSIFTPRHF